MEAEKDGKRDVLPRAGDPARQGNADMHVSDSACEDTQRATAGPLGKVIQTLLDVEKCGCFHEYCQVMCDASWWINVIDGERNGPGISRCVAVHHDC